jgi:carbon-monoxide dehydrogenase medium subunit
MKTGAWQDYLHPRDLAEALRAMAGAPGTALPLAGGTDLLLDLDQGRHAPVHTLVDITSVRELLPIEIRGHELFIGAAAPVSRIVDSPLVNQHAQALVEACELIGGPQVRNVATLGGNVAHALPAADGTVGLMVFAAEAEIASASGTRRVPFNDLFLGPGASSLKHGEELLVGFYLPISGIPNSSSCFKRIMRPQGVALPIINLAVWLVRDRDRIVDIRLAVGPAGPRPWLAEAAGESLRGQVLDESTSAQALDLLLRDAQFRSSPRRAGAPYRRHLVAGLFGDALQTAWERAGRS